MGMNAERKTNEELRWNCAPVIVKKCTNVKGITKCGAHCCLPSLRIFCPKHGEPKLDCDLVEMRVLAY